jgi:hypothetical protein
MDSIGGNYTRERTNQITQNSLFSSIPSPCTLLEVCLGMLGVEE